MRNFPRCQEAKINPESGPKLQICRVELPVRYMYLCLTFLVLGREVSGSVRFLPHLFPFTLLTSSPITHSYHLFALSHSMILRIGSHGSRDHQCLRSRTWPMQTKGRCRMTNIDVRSHTVPTFESRGCFESLINQCRLSTYARAKQPKASNNNISQYWPSRFAEIDRLEPWPKRTLLVHPSHHIINMHAPPGHQNHSHTQSSS